MPYKDPEAKKSWRRRNAKAIGDYTAKWKADNPERVAGYKAEARIKNRTIGGASRGIRTKESSSRKHRTKYRAMAIERLGGACEACGLSDPRALEFDHRVPLLRRTNGIRRADSLVAAREILAASDPTSVFALLCANCHRIKTREGGEWMPHADLVAAPPAGSPQLPLPLLGPS